MRLNPHYGDESFISFENLDFDPIELMNAQRSRFAEQLGKLSTEQLQSPSRCAGWTNLDVLTHLNSTNLFWEVSTKKGASGSPTKFLATFDPVESPAQMVRDAPAGEPGETVSAFANSNATLAEVTRPLRDVQWNLVVESPVGHVSLAAMALHALWDSFVHERDVMVPLGCAVSAPDDELQAVLTYAVALSPAYGLQQGFGGDLDVVVLGSGPDIGLLVSVGSRVVVGPWWKPQDRPSSSRRVEVRGETLDLIEGLSRRSDIAHNLSTQDRWVVDSLGYVFDQL